MTDAELDALVKLTEEFVTATWHLLDNSETSGPIDDPTITVWQPDFDEVSALLDRCDGLPSGSQEHMTAGGLLAANMASAITALRAQLAEVRAEFVRRIEMHECAMAERDDATLYSDEQKARADRAEAALAAQIEADDIPPFHFYRYINGVLMAEGVEINKETTLDSAMKVASRIASKGPNGEAPVLVYRAQPHDRTALDAAIRAAKVEALRRAEVATLGLATGHECRAAILALIRDGV